jgi:holo-ACP synthase CitX
MVKEQGNTLENILAARDERDRIQKLLLKQYKTTIITFTMNIPGPVKNTEWISRCFQYGKNDLLAYMRSTGLCPVVEKQTAAGPEAFFTADGTITPHAIKKIAITFEETHMAGRWFDIDIRSAEGTYISREQAGGHPRKCFLCGNDAKICARSRRHKPEELFEITKKYLTKYLDYKENDTANR